MENWAEIRRRVLVDGLSRRAACRAYGIHWKTLRKILSHPEPPGYRRTRPNRTSILEPFLPVVHQILRDDKKAPRKQRHTAVRIYRRLRDEHGYRGGLTVVKDAVRAWRGRNAEVFVPLARPPARRGPGRLRRGRGHARRTARPGGGVRHDVAVLRRAVLLRLPARVHRGVPRGPRPRLRLLRRRPPADQLRQPQDRRRQDHGQPPAEGHRRVPPAGEPPPLRGPLLPGAAAQREGARRDARRLRTPQLPGACPRRLRRPGVAQR